MNNGLWRSINGKNNCLNSLIFSTWLHLYFKAFNIHPAKLEYSWNHKKEFVKNQFWLCSNVSKMETDSVKALYGDI